MKSIQVNNLVFFLYQFLRFVSQHSDLNDHSYLSNLTDLSNLVVFTGVR